MQNGGTFHGQEIVAEGVKVNSVTGRVAVDGTVARIDDLQAQFDQGKVTGSGMVDFKAKSGQFSGQALQLGLTDLAHNLPRDTTLTGLLNAGFNAAFDKNGVTHASLDGKMQDVALNNVSLGAGTVSVRGGGADWTGSLNVGQLDRFIEVSNARYNANTKIAHADITAHDIQLHNLYAAARPYIATENDSAEAKAQAAVILPSLVAEQLDSMNGSVDLAASLNGKITNPDLNIETLEVSNVEVAQRGSGNITAKATRKNGVWDIQAFDWIGGPGVVTATGTVAEHGNIDVRGELNNLNSPLLALFQPALGRFAGSTNFSFQVTGPTKSPIIESSLQYQEGSATNRLDRRSLVVRATAREGEISASGSYYYNGFSGPI